MSDVNEKILVYYHGDLDGVCSAAIISKFYDFNNYRINAIPVQYDKDDFSAEEIEEASEVWVVDFTFKSMEKLAELAKGKLIWIDHHKTAMERHTELWYSDIQGRRSLSEAGCRLTWEYCFRLKRVPTAVEYIADRDMWIFDYEQTRAFCAGVNAFIENDPFNPHWEGLLSISNNTMFDCIIHGNLILKAQEVRVKSLFKSGVDLGFHGYQTRMVNATSDISELGEYIYKNGYELALIWQAKEGKIQFSMRSDKVDCSEIAKLYGGGGHPGAAGFTLWDTTSYPISVVKRYEELLE